MEQNKVQATTGITFRILVALSICHCLNDTLQSVISAVYPLFKEDLGLSFAQIGLITLVYQSAASVCQPLTGLFFDKWPSAWSLPTGMSFTLVGLLSLAFANTLPLVLCSVALDRLVGLPSGGLPVDFTRIGWKARIGAIVVPGRRKLGRIVGTVACSRFCRPLRAEAYRLVYDPGFYCDYGDDPCWALV